MRQKCLQQKGESGCARPSGRRSSRWRCAPRGPPRLYPPSSTSRPTRAARTTARAGRTPTRASSPALAAADASDEIWVAAATYKPTATADRTISFALKNGVGVYGGFDGTETMRSQRNPAAQRHDPLRRHRDRGSAADNSFHVVTVRRDGDQHRQARRLHGLRRPGGRQSGEQPGPRRRDLDQRRLRVHLGRDVHRQLRARFRGAGARVEAGAPPIPRCASSSPTPRPSAAAAAACRRAAARVSLESCVFRSNSISGATTGGGGLQTAGGTTLLNCVVAQNSPNGLQVPGNGNVDPGLDFHGQPAATARRSFSTATRSRNSLFWGDLGRSSSSTRPARRRRITYSDVQGGRRSPARATSTPIPNFLAAPSDLRPGLFSPAVDAGNNSACPAA